MNRVPVHQPLSHQGHHCSQQELVWLALRDGGGKGSQQYRTVDPDDLVYLGAGDCDVGMGCGRKREPFLLIFRSTRTGVRVAEGAGLENRYTRKGIVGSNPTLSVPPR